MLLLARVLLRTLSWLPAGGPIWLARRLAGTWMRLSPTKRHTTERNLERCFPDLAADARARLVRESFVHYVASVLEAGHNWYWPVEKLAARCEEVIGIEALEPAAAARALPVCPFTLADTLIRIGIHRGEGLCQSRHEIA